MLTIDLTEQQHEQLRQLANVAGSTAEKYAKQLVLLALSSVSSEVTVLAHRGVPVLKLTGSLGAEFAIAPGHSSLCGYGADCIRSCCDQIDKLLEHRMLTRHEQLKCRGLQRVPEVLASNDLAGKPAIQAAALALQGSLDLSETQAWLLATKLALHLQTAKATLAWAQSNSLRHGDLTRELEHRVAAAVRGRKLYEEQSL